jgi:hypothetical protein
MTNPVRKYVLVILGVFTGFVGVCSVVKTTLVIVYGGKRMAYDIYPSEVDEAAGFVSALNRQISGTEKHQLPDETAGEGPKL